jgi:hypothetical protein
VYATPNEADQINKNVMGGTCRTCEGDERCMQGLGAVNVGKENTWKT